MNNRERLLAALRRQPPGQIPTCTPTSVATAGLMEIARARFPEAHHEPELMAKLALFGHTVLGFDTVMPVFSVVQETSALGCDIAWGDMHTFPAVKMRQPLWREPDEIEIPGGFLGHPDVACVLESVRILKRELGDDAAVIGKAMGPWTLAYHCFGLEQFLLMTVDDPDKATLCLHRLKEITALFATAQIQAGADAITLPDHATGDLVSGRYYQRFLQGIHTELVRRIEAPVILHICGKTLDRLPFIAETGVAAFHFDSKNDPRAAVKAAGGRIALVGSVNNPATLLKGSPQDTRREVFLNLEAGVGLIGPECAVPLDTPVENLMEIPRAVRDWCAATSH